MLGNDSFFFLLCNANIIATYVPRQDRNEKLFSCIHFFNSLLDKQKLSNEHRFINLNCLQQTFTKTNRVI